VAGRGARGCPSFSEEFSAWGRAVACGGYAAITAPSVWVCVPFSTTRGRSAPCRRQAAFHSKACMPAQQAHQPQARSRSRRLFTQVRHGHDEEFCAASFSVHVLRGVGWGGGRRREGEGPDACWRIAGEKKEGRHVEL